MITFYIEIHRPAQLNAPMKRSDKSETPTKILRLVLLLKYFKKEGSETIAL